MNSAEYLIRLEDRLMVGYGRWVADFNESFRDLRVGETQYDMVLEGNMRPKGFLVSRFFAWIAMPAHQAACFVIQSDANASRVATMRKDIKDYMGERDLSWSWLVLLRSGPFSLLHRKTNASVSQGLQVTAAGPLQKMNLVRSVGMMFLAFFGIWALVSILVFRDILLSVPVLVLTLAFAAVFGWRLYRRKYHASLSYDAQGLDLQVGTQRWQAAWADFQRASLFHEGFGQFAVRLYRDGSEFLEVPASALKIDPSEFRFEAMDRIGSRTPSERR